MWRSPALALRPLVDLLARHVPLNAVAFLNPPLQLLSLAVDEGEIVVGQLAPLLLNLALGLFPVSFNSIPVHCSNSLFSLAHETRV